ncbi:hypothetical protein BB561_004225 [Smittium simulii]|uniref:RING-type domain-containing protein n=1 Tax=Smittium simulii TaxID=133385 RepID=A0A2T9YHD2_9FUNG|nr:hypothetical protein BB561_004225 [Smittium simulii]
MASYFDELNITEGEFPKLIISITFLILFYFITKDDENYEYQVNNESLSSFMTVSGNNNQAVSVLNSFRNNQENQFMQANLGMFADQQQFETFLAGLDQGQSNLSTYSTDKKFIESLPKLDPDQFKEDDSCIICDEFYIRENRSAKNKILRLPCNHNFDLDCILPWLKINNTCPVCRGELPSDNPEWIEKKKLKEKQQYRQEQDDAMYG